MAPDTQDKYKWAIATATRLARRMRIADRDDAIGDALLAFHTQILPGYDNARPFEPYAAVALRRILLNAARNQASRPLHGHPNLASLPVPDRDDRAPLNFFQIVHGLEPRTAIIFAAHYRDDYTVPQIARALGISQDLVKLEIENARKTIRATWGSRWRELAQMGS